MERIRAEEKCREEGMLGGWEEVREVVGDALHHSPLSEDEYLALRGRERVADEKVETEKQSLADYIRVSLNTYMYILSLNVHIT